MLDVSQSTVGVLSVMVLLAVRRLQQGVIAAVYGDGLLEVTL